MLLKQQSALNRFAIGTAMVPPRFLFLRAAAACDCCLRRCIDVNNTEWQIIFSIYQSRGSLVIDPRVYDADTRGAAAAAAAVWLISVEWREGWR